MAAIKKSIHIEAPPERVFEYFADSRHLPEIWPSMVDVTGIEKMPNGGERFHWVYKMAGMRFEGDSEPVEFERDRHVVRKSTGAFPSTFDWTFSSENGGTRLDVKVEYEVPQTLLRKVAEPFVLRLNEREAGMVLENLKDRVES
jgi:uncharacterized protein YndB with AHSA1/START domain